MLAVTPIDLSKVNGENIDKEILRFGIIAELDAINLYEQLSENTTDSHIKKVLLDIAREEKEHVGEFKALLYKLDKEQTEMEDSGAKEVEELLEE
ncbi:MAG: ferritin family protein [Candidatus Dojkabacteria bacterium]|nr:ferritin family protein [Candidatus Dojkabacteria bacterium]